MNQTWFFNVNVAINAAYSLLLHNALFHTSFKVNMKQVTWDNHLFAFKMAIYIYLLSVCLCIIL